LEWLSSSFFGFFFFPSALLEEALLEEALRFLGLKKSLTTLSPFFSLIVAVYRQG
jgi:hypothetical protein